MSKRRGMSLIEVIISIAILSIIGIGFVYVFTGGFALFGRAAAIEKGQYTARQYAEEKSAGGASSQADSSFTAGGVQFTVSRVRVEDPDSGVGYTYYEAE